MQNLKENNILIAEFLDNEYKNGDYFKLNIPTENYNIFHIEDLKFNSDWNWLMLVADKIESLGGYFKSFRWTEEEQLLKGYWCTIEDHFTNVVLADSAQIKDTETKIEATYLACIEFIKWYNNNNQN